MRISDKEKSAILHSVKNKDPEAEIYLYGSRADNSLRGGDIDLLVISEKLDFTDQIDLLVKIKGEIGEQKIDLLIRSQKNLDPFVRKILGRAVRID